MVAERSAVSRLLNGFNVFLLIAIAILCILPVWYTLAISLSNKSAVAAGQVFLWPKGFTLGSYEAIINDRQFFRSFLISVQRVVYASVLSFLVILMRDLGMINNIWGLVPGGGLPIYNVILVMNYFRNLPKEMEESALIDGAGPWRILFSVFLPLSMPVMATILVFTIVYHWNEFFQALVLMTKKRSRGFFDRKSYRKLQWDTRAPALSFTFCYPTVILHI